jgi:hypothetical protein
MADPTMLERLLAAMEDAKATIRQAHEAQQGLKQTIAEAREVGRALQRDEFEPWLRGEVAKQLHQLGEELQVHRDRSVERVIASFDELKNLLMTGDERGRGRSLEPDIRRVARERHEQNGGV